MPTMNVNLTPEMADFVAEEISKGDYASASELVRDALRLLRRDIESENERMEILRREIDLGVEDMRRRSFSTRSAKEIALRILDGSE